MGEIDEHQHGASGTLDETRAKLKHNPILLLTWVGMKDSGEVFGMAIDEHDYYKMISISFFGNYDDPAMFVLVQDWRRYHKLKNTTLDYFYLPISKYYTPI